MAADGDLGDNMYSAVDDKEDLIPGSLVGKGGNVLSKEESNNGDSNRNEASPLHRLGSSTHSGKDICHSRGLQLIIGSMVVFSVVITVALIISIYVMDPQIGASGAVASDVGICSDQGLEILKRGGNAVDAAVTTMLCVGVVDAQSSGIGGGGFMLVHDHKNQESQVYDFREVAPSGASRDAYKQDENAAKKGGMAVGVPGELKGMEFAHKKHGKLPWSDVVTPAAKLAREGFPITKSMANVFKRNKVKLSDFMGNLGMYYTVNGGFVSEGDVIKRPDLADTLDIIAKTGSAAFYDGVLSDGIINAVNSGLPTGQIWMTREDLRKYKVKERSIVSGTYHDSTIISVPAPGSGPVVLSMMNFLEGYNLKADDAFTASTYHKFLEATKFAYAQQQFLGDPEFNEEAVINVTRKMISKEVADKHRKLTTNVTHQDLSVYGATASSLLDKGTSHISIIDAQELMVSVTTTVNYWFGSKVMTDTGILLNNQMADFSLTDTDPNKMNFIQPGKRPQSNMAPTIVYNTDHSCKLRVNLGAANGSYIPTAIVETLLNVVSFGKSLTSAIQAPRMHCQLSPPKVYYEEGIKTDVIENLVSRGHKMEQAVEGISIVQGVKKVMDTVEAYSDSRKGGRAASFNSQ